MAEAKEIGGYISTVAGLGMECTGFAPSWVLLQTIIFTISTGLAVFDTYTDWEVVLNFRVVGFNNPLLQRDENWLRAWFFFAALGTLLTAISILHDGIDLLYAYCKSCQKHCCKGSKDRYDATNQMFEMKKKGSDVDSKSKTDKEGEFEEIEDACKCCFRLGWNSTTRNETLGALTLWFQDFPMLTLAILYAFSQFTCKSPDKKDATAPLLDVGISVIASLVAASWRLLRSFTRLYSSIAVRTDPKKKSIKRCLPKKSEAAYPPGSCSQFCLWPFYFGLLLEISAVMALGIITGVIWHNYAQLKNAGNFDDSLGIYRYSVNLPPENHTLLFNISGTIIPPNGTFLNLEKAPESELDFDDDVFCLSEFEYRPDDFQIYFNAIELIVVSPEGKFCASVPATGVSTCSFLYTFADFVLYYASIDPVTGGVRRFDQQCSLFDFSAEFATPKVDANIDVNRHLDRTGFPQNGEPLIIILSSSYYLLVSTVLSTPNLQYEGISVNVIPDLSCAFEFQYLPYSGQIRYNYRDVIRYGQNNCSCSSSNICSLVLRNMRYGYLTPQQTVVPYTHCSTIPYDKLIPYHEADRFVSCPC